MKVAIIGAGAAGLCCARHFSKFPEKFSIQVYEQASTIGGTWVYTDKTGEDEYGLPVHTSMYKDLRYASALAMLVSGIDRLYYLCLGYPHPQATYCRSNCSLGRPLRGSGYARLRLTQKTECNQCVYGTIQYTPKYMWQVNKPLFFAGAIFFAIFSSTEM